MKIPPPLTIAAYAFAVLVAIALFVAVWGVVTDPFGFRRHALAKAQTQAAVATGAQAVAGGQLKAAGDAQVITDKARARDDSTARTREGNHAAILQAKGADVPLDPVLVAAARRGLCRYSLYAGDPDCVAVRRDDSAIVPSPR